MSRNGVEPHAKKDIDRLVQRVLRDAGYREPPVDVSRVLATLRLDREFYDLEDPGLTRRLHHRVKIGSKLWADYLEKIKLQALLLFDDRRVLLDGRLPEVKHDWATAHEVGHELIPWHREFCRGDTVETLDPDWHDTLEAEANYAAASLLFCGDVFAAEAKDTRPSWSTIRALRRRYRKSLQMTARRYVEHGPDAPMALLVSTAPWDPQPSSQVGRVRHLVLSSSFEARFQAPDPDSLRERVDACVQKKRGGPVGELVCRLPDRNGHEYLFYGECFYNQHYVMSLFFP